MTANFYPYTPPRSVAFWIFRFVAEAINLADILEHAFINLIQFPNVLGRVIISAAFVSKQLQRAARVGIDAVSVAIRSLRVQKDRENLCRIISRLFDQIGKKDL